ncbi:MAG TPA: ribonuclease III [Candidatus Moranbacteria bacterium]|nr:ribonuclease III [Candidatus Moranbacteria bacterium]HAT75024.1 ribonuclease III [Candidatus Moranbacteria bacterium]
MLVLENLAKKLEVKFNNIELLQQAVTHRSYLNEHRGYKLDHNERLEFLGDAVLELVVTEYLYNNYSNPEGEMTNWRAALVNGEMLAKISGEIGVEEYLMMSRGEAKDKGRARQYLLANAFEAIVGAIYLDQKTKGYDVCKKFILKNVVIKLPNIIEKKLYFDAKSRFQEEAQERAGITPSYRVLEESGPDHDKKFIVGVFLSEEMIAKGEGLSKQEAQRSAAENALEERGW